MLFDYFHRRASGFAFVLCAALVLAPGAVVHAKSSAEDVPPGVQEYRHLGHSEVKAALPDPLVGMDRVRAGMTPMAVMALYKGGAPLPTVSLYISTSGRMLKMTKRMVEQGKLSTTTRNGRTVYLRIKGPEGGVSKEPGVAMVMHDTFVAISGKPGDAKNLSVDAVRKQLFAVLEALDPERVASVQAPSLLSSGQFKVSGAFDATLKITAAAPHFMGGFTDTRWSIELINEARQMSVRIWWLPVDIEPGQYTLHEQPSYMADGWMERLSVKFHVDEAGPSEHHGYWSEKVTGTLTVESVKNGRMTGHFKFTAYRDGGASPVTVKGWFQDLVILDGE